MFFFHSGDDKQKVHLAGVGGLDLRARLRRDGISPLGFAAAPALHFHD